MTTLPGLDALLHDTPLANPARADRLPLAAAHAAIEAVLLRTAAPRPEDWEAAERSLGASGFRDRCATRAAFVALFSRLRPVVTIPLPRWPLLVAPRPEQPLFKATDASQAQAWDAAWKAFEPTLRAPWETTEVAAMAVAMTAVLRMDATSKDELAQLLACPLADLAPDAACGMDGARRQLEAVTALAVARLRQQAPTLTHLGACLRLAQVTSHVRALCKAEGVRDPWAAATAWRRLHLPMSVLSPFPARASTAPVVAPAWQGIAGTAVSAPARVPAARRQRAAGIPSPQRLPYAKPVAPGREQKTLRELARVLDGSPVADLGQRSYLTIPAARSHVAAFMMSGLISTLGQLILSFIDDRLEHGCKAATASRYVSALLPLIEAQGLQPVVTPANDGSLDVDLDHMEAMLQAVARDSRDTLTPRVLAQFHQFLVDRHPVFEEIDLDALPGLASAPSPRKALLRPGQFEHILGHWAEADDATAAAGLAAALAFYTGLRRREVLGLRISDIVDPTTLHTAVRSHVARRLKTDAARRDLPLGVLLPPHWASVLRTRLALMQAAAANAYLFARPDAPRAAPGEALLSPALQALRTGAAQPTLTFHGLRHAFVTWGFLRLALAHTPRLRAFPIDAFGDPEFASDAVRAWLAALWPDARHGIPWDAPKRLAYLAGHRQPDISVRWYAHLHDVIEKGLLGLHLPRPSRATLKALHGGSPRQFQRVEDEGRQRLRARLSGDTDFPTAWALVEGQVRVAVRLARRARRRTPTA